MRDDLKAALRSCRSSKTFTAVALIVLALGIGASTAVFSVVGIYGIMAYVVSHRTREIGVRMALGATRLSVVRLVLTNAGLMIVAGLLLGSAGACYLSSTAKVFLFRLDADNPRAFAAALGTLAVAAIVGSVVPARRAASVDPMIALRGE